MAAGGFESINGDLHMDSLKDMITCPICKEIPDKHIALPCFHSFCEQCVYQLPNEQASGIKCPICRNFSNPEEMGPHPLMKSLLNSYHSIQRTRTEGIPCSQCRANNAKWRCIQCDVIYCDADASGHTNLPVCRGHHLVHMHSAEVHQLARPDPIVHCSKHPKKELEYHCANHKTAICTSCHAFQHKTCTITEIDQGVEEAKPEVERCLELIVKRKAVMERAVDKLSDKLKAVHANQQAMEERINRRTEELMRRILAEGEEMKTEVRERSSARAKQIQFEKEEMEYSTCSMDSMIAWTRNVITNTSGASLLQELYERILPRLQTTMHDPDSFVPHVDPTVPVMKPIHHPDTARFIGNIELNNVNFMRQASFRKSEIPFDELSKLEAKHVTTFKVNNDCFRMCFHNNAFWLPSPTNNEIRLFSLTGHNQSVVTLKRVSRPRAVSVLTEETVIVACETGLLVMLSNDCESDDSNGQILHRGDYCDVYVDCDVIYALDYEHNKVDVFKPNARQNSEISYSFHLQKPTNHHDRLLVNDDEIYVSSSLQGDVTVYDKQGAPLRSLSEGIIQQPGGNTLICGHDMKQQILVVNNKSTKFQVTNCDNPFNLEMSDVANPWDVCLTSPNTLQVLANSISDNQAYVHSFRME